MAELLDLVPWGLLWLPAHPGLAPGFLKTLERSVAINFTAVYIVRRQQKPVGWQEIPSPGERLAMITNTHIMNLLLLCKYLLIVSIGALDSEIRTSISTFFKWLLSLQKLFLKKLRGF